MRFSGEQFFPRSKSIDDDWQSGLLRGLLALHLIKISFKRDDIAREFAQLNL